MKRRPEQNVFFATFALLVLAGLILRNVPGAETLSDAVEERLTPVQSALTAGATSLRGLSSAREDAATLRQRMTELEQENERLQVENQQIQDLRREIRQLREELKFAQERPDLDLLGASVTGNKVAAEPGPIVRAVKLDIGSVQGVAERMTVASHRGLVGQVAELGENWCNVLLLTDPRSRVAARIDRSGKTGVVFGSASGELIMRHIPQNHENDADPFVQAGDLIETSGMSQRFPGQILIGQVVEVRQNDVAKWQEAVILPSVDFDALEMAMVVTKWVPTSAR